MKIPLADPEWQAPGGAHRRYPAVAANVMAATSHPMATRAALRMLERGGNAADAAVAAAGVLCAVEPMWTGLGGDCFALVWKDGSALGLDAAGAAPRNATPVRPVDERGPRSVTVPGAVGGWDALLRRYGKFGLDTCLADGIETAERGFALTPVVAWHWGHNERPAEFAEVPKPGALVRMPELARTLRTLASEGPAAFYNGPIARAIADACWLEEADLAAFQMRWVEPIEIKYRGVRVLEMPAPTQGVVVLEGLGLLADTTTDLAGRIAAVTLALDDARKHVRDGADVRHLLDPKYLKQRLSAGIAVAKEPAGGTIYVSVVDADRMAVSFIQSLYMPFGSRVVVPGTGILLQNRGACFSIHGEVEPGRRPYHTILPALLLRDNSLLGAFGCVGGFVQAQAHVQIVSNLLDDGMDPQTAIDRPRFMVDGDVVKIEQGLWHQADELRRRGFRPVQHAARFTFGAGQAVLVTDDGLAGGSDSRKDGFAAGY